MNQSVLGLYFEEFEVGSEIKHALSKTIFESDNNFFSLMTMNHHPVHTNMDYAAQNQQGMLVLNPKEIPLVHQYFSPSAEEIAWASEMVQLAAEAEKEGKGVAVKDNKFIGPPMVKMAKDILKKHEIIVQRSTAAY